MIKKFLFIVLLSSLMVLSFAQEKQNLYRVTVPIATQTQEHKVSAFRQGLLDTLVKLSGNQHVGENKTIRTILNRPQDFVDEFSYETSSDPSFPYELKILFNKADIQHLLKKAQVPFWSEGFPTTIVWLSVTDRGHSNEILGNETPDDNATLLKQTGLKFKLPIVLPMMDMVDMERITPPDVNALDLNKIKQASERYTTDAILMGNVNQHHDEYQSSWQLVLNDGANWNWSITEDTMQKLFETIFNQINITLSQYYLQKDNEAKQYLLTLQIENIVERNDLSGVIKFLKNLSMVRQVQLSQISGDIIELAVLIQGDIANFKEAAMADNHLRIRSEDSEQHKYICEWIR